MNIPRFKIPPSGRAAKYDHSEIRDLIKTGEKYVDIARKIGCSKSVVTAVGLKSGIIKRRKSGSLQMREKEGGF